MSRFIVRRLLQAIPLLFLVSVCVFTLIRLVPGGPMGVYGKSPNITAEMLQRLEAKFGVDQPLHIQYIRWLGNLLRGDFGYSYDTRRPAVTEIKERLVPTLYLMIVTFAVVISISIPVGMIAAIKQHSWVDIAVSTLAFAGQALPVFWVGLMLVMLFYAFLKNPFTGGPILPAGGMRTLGQPFSVGDYIRHLILPVTTLALAWVSWYSRYLRASMLDVIHEDYIRTARAKGLRERAVILRHAFKNAAIPLVTMIALDIPFLFNGALYTEIIFAWPGMGRLFFRAAVRRDYPVLMGTIMISSVLVILSNLLADMIYAYLDPRIRYE